MQMWDKYYEKLGNQVKTDILPYTMLLVSDLSVPAQRYISLLHQTTTMSEEDWGNL